MDSTPPATTTSAMPDRMLAAASWTAIMPVAHWRCTAPPGRVGRQAQRVGDVARRAPAALEHLARAPGRRCRPARCPAAAMTRRPPSARRALEGSARARPRPARPMAVRTAATMTASWAGFGHVGSSGSDEDGDGELVGDRSERDLEGHADLQLVEGAVDDVGHHPRPLGEVDDGGHVGDTVAERGLVVVVDDRPGVEGARRRWPRTIRPVRSSTSGRTAGGSTSRRRSRGSA